MGGGGSRSSSSPAAYSAAPAAAGPGFAASTVSTRGDDTYYPGGRSFRAYPREGSVSYTPPVVAGSFESPASPPYIPQPPVAYVSTAVRGQCNDFMNWRDADGDGCTTYEMNARFCGVARDLAFSDGTSALEACCVCGGGVRA
eukprot:GDKH01000591.1.p1 GENE.GDKH01000591.1~~GDKH01000591.1.p1  ORF type:complete len:143 (-),score=12.63 GDKH01000591.1:488-916(-)